MRFREEFAPHFADNFFYCIINLLDQYEFHHYNVRNSHIMKAVA